MTQWKRCPPKPLIPKFDEILWNALDKHWAHTVNVLLLARVETVPPTPLQQQVSAIELTWGEMMSFHFVRLSRVVYGSGCMKKVHLTWHATGLNMNTAHLFLCIYACMIIIVSCMTLHVYMSTPQNHHTAACRTTPT